MIANRVGLFARSEMGCKNPISPFSWGFLPSRFPRTFPSVPSFRLTQVARSGFHLEHSVVPFLQQKQLTKNDQQCLCWQKIIMTIIQWQTHTDLPYRSSSTEYSPSVTRICPYGKYKALCDHKQLSDLRSEHPQQPVGWSELLLELASTF